MFGASSEPASLMEFGFKYFWMESRTGACSRYSAAEGAVKNEDVIL